MNIFQRIKSEVDFLSAMEHYCGPLKQVGDDTYTTEEDECPIHGGHGCFRMKVDGEDSIVNCFGNCNHDDWPLDIIGFVQVHLGLETIGEAARQIAKDFNVSAPVETAAVRIYKEAGRYYRDMFELSIKKLKCLGNRTPMGYQVEVRHHTEDTLKKIGIGWSDGKLTEHLEDDFSVEDLLGSGLVKMNRGKMVDVIPADSFTYQHVWNGMVSNFTFKHTGGLNFQILKKCRLNEVLFYTIGSGSPIAVVEGENDLAALIDEGWDTQILCTNGSFSKAQIEWMCDNDGEYHTFWDGDAAGQKYADKIWTKHLSGKMPNVVQFQLPDGSDVDTFRVEHDLAELPIMASPDQEDALTVVDRTKGDLIEEGGCYKAVTKVKDGEGVIKTQISDFTIRLLYVKVQGEERSRVIRIIRNDGRKSRPVVVNSEAKVSLRHWRILVANAVDASFVGSENDLANMWTYIYSHQREAVVDVPPCIGDMEDGDGWLFGNQFVGPEGDIKSDDDNIMWFDEKRTRGIAPKSLMASLASNHTAADIPLSWSSPDTEEFIEEICRNLAAVLKDPGMVMVIMGWMRSCAYSMPLFYKAKMKFFPFLLLWGRHGRGKSTLANWMLSFYDMADKGTTTVGQLRSGVGIERKLAYYRGLPYCIDELRADRQASEYSRTWRGWYNRSSRVKGTRQGEDVVQVPLNACLFFSGQDTFTDPAMRSRCIPCKFPTNAGDDNAYTWLEDEVDEFPSVGYHWIRESMDSDIVDVEKGIREYQSELKVKTPGGISSRSLGNYAMVGYFAKELAERVFPDLDLQDWLVNAMSNEHSEAVEEDMVARFWDGVAGLQIGDRPGINGNHVSVRNDKLYVWYAETHSLVAGNNRGSDAREAFSKGAVRDALVEEVYFERTATMRMGATDTTRRCLVFNVNHPEAPQEFLAVVETARSSL